MYKKVLVALVTVHRRNVEPLGAEKGDDLRFPFHKHDFFVDLLAMGGCVIHNRCDA